MMGDRLGRAGLLRRRAFLALAASVAASCVVTDRVDRGVPVSPELRAEPPRAEACPSPAPLEPDPRRDDILLGVRVGPLIFRTGHWPDPTPPGPDAVARVFGWQSPASRIKVLIEPSEAIERPLSVSGRSCPDGERLRFFADGAVGAEADTIRIDRPSAREFADRAAWGSRFLYGGPWIFSQPGIWVIRVHDGNREIGSFATLVPAPPPSD